MVDSQLRRRMNSTHSSTRILPNEILSFIFELVCAPTLADDPPNNCPRITLASVSSHWHHIVWTTPQIWQTFSASVQSHSLRKMVSALQMFADNHRAPSSIWLGFKFLRKEDIEELLKPWETMLSQETASHIRRIGLCDLQPKYLAVVTLVNERCSNIEELYLSQKCPSWYGALQAHLLKPAPKIQIPTCWSTLSTLEIKSFPLDICFELFLGCPRLIKLSCHTPTRPANDLVQPQSHHAQMTSFPHLKYLSLSWNAFCRSWLPWFDSLLERYHFPALKELHWSISRHHDSLELFNRFSSALPRCCDTLRLSVDVGFFDTSLQQRTKFALLHIGKIKNLIFSSYDLSFFALVTQMLQDSAFIPSLTSFKSCHSAATYTQGDRPVISSIYKVLHGRKKTGVKSFSFQLPEWEFADWAAQRAELSRLMDDGSFKVEIIRGHEKFNL